MDNFNDGIKNAMSIRGKLKQFLLDGNVIGTLGSVTIAFSFGNMVRSFVNEILFPTIYHYTANKSTGEFLPINKANVSRFSKEFITLLLVILCTYFFVKFVLTYMFNIGDGDLSNKKDDDKKKAVAVESFLSGYKY